MKIALSAGLLLGLAQYVAGFGCNWDGSGSSYVYHNINWEESGCPCCLGCNGCDCIDGVYNGYQQTTCCRCATVGECESPPAMDDNTGFDDFDDSYWGCDLYPPIIHTADAVEAASAPGMWFTNSAQLNNFLETTVECEDDCNVEPWCDKNVIYRDNNNNWLCGNTIVRVTSADWINCDNQNNNMKDFRVRYDEVAPVVTVNLGQFKDKKEVDSRKYEDIPLSIGVSDNCDLNPEVTITVYSDEIEVHELTKPPAVLERLYSNVTGNGVLMGWGLTLDRYRYAQKLCGSHLECYEADGRYYVVRVCAKDEAGLWSCAEDSVGVPLKPMEAKHIVPENQGKLFIVAEDRGFWRMAPNEIPFRNENTWLDNAGEANYRVCWSNQVPVATGLLGNAFRADSLDQCGLACQNTNGCYGFVYNFYVGAPTANCQLYNINMGARWLETTGEGNIISGLNTYVMGTNTCPGIGQGNNP